MKKDDIYRSQFRLPWELYEKLREESEKNRRSLNAEIVARLQESLSMPSEGESDLEMAIRRARAGLDQSQAEVAYFMQKYQSLLHKLERQRRKGRE